MSKDKYIEIINDLCKKLNVEDPSTQYDACHLEISGAVFTLTFRPEKNSERLFIYTDCGEPDAVIKAKALHRILETNLSLHGYGQAHFGLNPQTKHVIFMGHAPLKDLNIDVLLHILGLMAIYVNDMKETYLLTREELNDLYFNHANKNAVKGEDTAVQ